MNFFNNIFKNTFKTSPIKEEIEDPHANLSFDQKFVKKFIQKGGKFLYCSNWEETKSNLRHILEENEWNDIVCFENELDKLLEDIACEKTTNIDLKKPFLTTCESLIANDGSIMFSSKQLNDKKLNDLSNNFIVFAKTSQLSKDTREGIAGIRNRSEKNAATIICCIKDYLPNKTETDFMTYGNTNAKTLYLLLLEDL